MRRWLPLLCIALFFVGLQLLLAENRATLAFWQIAIFAILIIALTAWGESRTSNQMKGCMTILSMLFGPFLALLMALIDQLALWSALDPAIAWAGSFRLPALMALAGSTVALIVAAGRALRGKKRLRFPETLGDALLGLFVSALVGIFSSLAGLAWLAIGWGLSRIGL